MNPDHPHPPKPGVFFGWRVVAAVFVLAMFGWGFGFYGPPIFLQTLRETRGWSVSLVSTAVTLHFLVGVLVVANLAKLHARFGIATVTKAGAVTLACGVIGWAIAREPWQLMLATLLSGAGWVTLGAAAVNAIIAPWFVKARPAALSAAYNGSSVGGIVFAPLWVAVIGAFGFPVAALGIGIVMIATIWILADLYYAKRPEHLGLVPDGGVAAAANRKSDEATPAAPKQLWRDVRFITIAAGVSLGLFAQIGLLAHLFSLLVPALGASAAGLTMSAATAAAIFGRTLVGWTMPAGADRRIFASISYAVQIAGCCALALAAGQSHALLLIGVILFGFGIGNATSLPPLIAQSEFNENDVTRVVPMVVATGQASYAFAPAAFGLIREFSAGSGTMVFVVAAIVEALAIIALLVGRRR